MMTIARDIGANDGRRASDAAPCRDIVYLDNQASTRPDPKVVEAMLPWLDVAANPHAVEHAAGRAAAAAVEQARERVAALLACEPSEVTFTSGATEATNIVLRGLLYKGDRLVVSAIEHPSVAASARALAGEGVDVTIVGVSDEGLIDLDAFEEALISGATLASVMQVNNEIGTIQPIADVAAICAASETALHCDMTQGAGRMSSPLGDGQVAYASLSAHKIHGPQGIGALFLRHGARRPRAPSHGGGQERGVRPGTLPVAACVGFGKACEIALQRREEDAQHALSLQRAVLAVLSGLEGWHVNGSLELRVPHNLSLTFAAVEADALMAMLPGYALATGSACSGAAPGSSPTLQAIGLDPAAIAATVRIGFGRDTTREEVVQAAGAISDAVRRLRGMK
jgi:cysteine desulfurase